MAGRGRHLAVKGRGIMGESGRRRSRIRSHAPLILVLVVGLVLATGLVATGNPGQPAADIDQCRNGTPSAFNDCEDLGGGVGWVNGNAGGTNAHYAEGLSIPYRVRMTDVPPAISIKLILGYDITHSGKHAIDFLTHFDRLEPHSVFGHTAEDVVPLSGVSGVSGTVSTFAIPPPSSTSLCTSPATGQPTTRFNSLPAGERVMTLFGGTITAVTYGTQGCLTNAQAETTIEVTFTADSATAVLAWGGHIARAEDWGEGNSASGVSGSPYHMRLKDWDCTALTGKACPLGNLGNQDRSLSTEAVLAPPQLIVIKHVINDDGGTAVAGDFTMAVSATNPSPASFPGEESPGTTVGLDAGSYNVTESGPAGYTASFSADCSGSIADGETKTCTVTNDDNAPGLIVIKHVINDDGGTAVAGDFTMAVSAGSASPASFAGVESPGTAVAIDANDPYAVTESGPAGYTASFSADCTDTDGLDLGETKTCTVTNDDVPTNEGCTPGFWKNHTDLWVTYSPGQTVESVFNVPDQFGLDNDTLLTALDYPGGNGPSGAAQILLRAAVAALLNAASPDVDYPLTEAEIIDQVNAALAGNRPTMLALAIQLDGFNNLGCPIGTPTQASVLVPVILATTAAAIVGTLRRGRRETRR